MWVKPKYYGYEIYRIPLRNSEAASLRLLVIRFATVNTSLSTSEKIEIIVTFRSIYGLANRLLYPWII